MTCIWVTVVAALIWTMGAVPKDPEGFANHTATPDRGTACAGSLAQPELLQRRESRPLNLPAIVHPLRQYMSLVFMHVCAQQKRR